MKRYNFDTLSEAVNTLTQEGYKESFEAGDNYINALYSKKEYDPSQLTILASYRFEGMTNPSDQATVFAIKANDGVLGTLIMSNSTEHNQNVDLIQKIPSSRQ